MLNTNYFMKINTKILALTAVIFAAVAGNAQTTATGKAKPGLELKYMDKSVKPSEDFFRFVNGKWLDATKIPEDKAVWGGFNELAENTDKTSLSILKEAAEKNLPSNTDQAKAVNLYKSIMDTVARNKAGVKPLEPFLKKIDAVKNVKDLQALLVEMESQGGVGFFNVFIYTDAKDTNRYTLYLATGVLGLPDRDYYVGTDADVKEKRVKYEQHVARMLMYLGYKDAAAKNAAKRILALETAMSTPRLDRVESRDLRKMYNPMSMAQIQKLTPAIDWYSYLADVGVGKRDSIVVLEPKYMAALQTIFTQNKVQDWKDYMKWMLLNNAGDELSTAIETANWEFYSKTMRGAMKEEKRDMKALNTINETIGEALGKLYVEKKFPAEAKAKAEDMIKNIKLAFENRINNLPWMTKATRENAITKLRKMAVKVGYPDKWKDYSALVIKSQAEGGTLHGNALSLARWNFKENLQKLSKPVDKTEWSMPPQQVNAYFNPFFNEIVFPAAILQPPFYDYKADEAVNYGGIGAVIGHEISHGFDDSGSRFNAEGNMVNWWSDEDMEKFTGLGSSLADQYSTLQPLPGIFVDGKFTLGENIGDLGGVNAAYDGLQLYLKQHGSPGLIDGFTPEQRFFISWATIWRTKSRDEAIKSQVKTDPHSPGEYRAYVPLQNIDAFYKAFDIKPGDKMYVAPDKRVKIW